MESKIAYCVCYWYLTDTQIQMNCEEIENHAEINILTVNNKCNRIHITAVIQTIMLIKLLRMWGSSDSADIKRKKGIKWVFMTWEVTAEMTFSSILSDIIDDNSNLILCIKRLANSVSKCIR